MLYEKAMYYFRCISGIPRTTHHCEKIAEYIVDFAYKRSLDCTVDEANNVIVTKKASAGRENEITVMLQGHTDMVGDKSADSAHNFLTDALTLCEKDGFLSADGTTLGADDGAAVSIMLAVLDSDELSAPRLECVFTSDEEDGLDGAKSIDLSKTEGKYMINLDSEDEGVFTCGCAGGARIDCTVPLQSSDISGESYEITLSGLHGGHSAEEIANGRLNSAKLICSIVKNCAPTALIKLSSGSRDNAIPHSAKATVIGDGDTIRAVCKKAAAEAKKSEPDIKTEVTLLGAYSGLAICGSEISRICDFVAALPNGVYKMSEVKKGSVDTSDNLGILNVGKLLSCTLLARSASDKRKSELCSKIIDAVKTYGGTAEVRSSYPGWEYESISPLREHMCTVFREIYGYEAKTEVIHAGLECGILKSKKPSLDIVSAGCNTEGIHTYHERLDLSSFKRLCEFIEEILKRNII